LGSAQLSALPSRIAYAKRNPNTCEKVGITADVPKPICGPATAEGFVSKEQFRYDPDKDIYLCPADQVLSPRHFGKSRDNVKINHVNRDACKACSLRERCTKCLRRVSRLENEAVLGRVAARLAARPDVLDQRRESVEHPFGTLKQWMYQGAFLMRRLENVRGAFSLTALSHNIKRAISLVGVSGLIAAVRT
jgi:hypothetical protein